jgi:hypothetical protein
LLPLLLLLLLLLSPIKHKSHRPAKCRALY